MFSLTANVKVEVDPAAPAVPSIASRAADAIYNVTRANLT